MSSKTTVVPHPVVLKEGVYKWSNPDDKRSPCPLLNALANHGHLPRDGKNISGDDFVAALSKAGIAGTLAAVLSRPIYVAFQDPKLAYTTKPRGTLEKLWYYYANPWATILGGYGLWDGVSYNDTSQRVMDLDRLALHGVAEHDISMTRRDTAEKAGANDPQFDLIDELLEMSENGYITKDHMIAFRKRRIEDQLESNPGLYYGPWEHQTACSNIALILNTFGDGEKVRTNVLSALIKDERLPFEEGWQPRTWWKLGAITLATAANAIKAKIGLNL